VEHRLEKFIKVGGVRFINDSKATNVNSTWYALQSIDGQVILILGGKDEGNDYGILKDLVHQKVKAIVCMGADNTPIISAFSGITELYDTHSMTEAVEKAYTLAKEGDTVLLSPACKSFDLFQNYEDRGLQFKKAVREL
jgi:UDP-N-acetylmuramoylalanine--D-glutamate ligase